MKKTKKVVISLLTACAVTLHTGTVSLAAEHIYPSAGMFMPARTGEIIQRNINLSIVEKAMQIFEKRSEEMIQAAEEEAARLKAEEEARLAAEEAERLAEEQEAAEQAAKEQAAAEETASAYTAAVSADDEALLAALIYCEAGGEPYEGQVAVGAVVMNRVRSGAFPNSVREVIYQSGQFGPAITGKLESVLANGSTTDSCRQAASEALAGVSPVGDAIYFGDGQDFGQQIGGHWFHS